MFVLRSASDSLPIKPPRELSVVRPCPHNGAWQVGKPIYYIRGRMIFRKTRSSTSKSQIASRTVGSVLASGSTSVPAMERFLISQVSPRYYKRLVLTKKLQNPCSMVFRGTVQITTSR
ncbi:hypothetical protein E2C01_025539 [Portunus trituberculatus]|uniref:Uncharacterized protein n=1 Tax=Portunus trituberculatus TaxID=210409 RepID=A0A5B7EDK5_PORTR|nr:hypothetical protein [Portunus trituberculatus]